MGQEREVRAGKEKAGKGGIIPYHKFFDPQLAICLDL